MQADKIPKQIKRKLRILNFQAAIPTEKKYLRNTEEHLNIYTSAEKSPLFGFTKIRNRLRDDFMERIKWKTVNDNIQEKITIRDRLIFIRTLKQGGGSARGMAFRQFYHISHNSNVNPDAYKYIDGQQLWDELLEYTRDKWDL